MTASLSAFATSSLFIEVVGRGEALAFGRSSGGVGAWMASADLDRLTRAKFQR